MMLKNKKALESEVLIGIIITLIVAAVIFFFLRGLTLKGTIDKEACHQTVLMRSMPVGIGETMKKSIPLKCKTEDILISFQDEELIKQRIANAMYDCWWMLGEGRLSPFLEGTLKEMSIMPAKSMCVICSTIGFSDRVRAKYSEIDITDYLQNTKIPLQNRTYIEYFSDEEGTRLPTGVKIQPIETSKKYAIIFFAFESEALLKGSGTTGGLVMIGSKMFGPLVATLAGEQILTLPFGILQGLLRTGQALTGAALSAIGTPLLIASAALMLWQTGVSTWGQYVTAAGYCNGENKGCFQVVLTEYDKNALAKTCGNIESIP